MIQNTTQYISNAFQCIFTRKRKCVGGGRDVRYLLVIQFRFASRIVTW